LEACVALARLPTLAQRRFASPLMTALTTASGVFIAINYDAASSIVQVVNKYSLPAKHLPALIH
jgi:hypothetical protein